MTDVREPWRAPESTIWRDADPSGRSHEATGLRSRTLQRKWIRRGACAAAAVGALVPILPSIAAQSTSTAAIDRTMVFYVAVSPAYEHTGLVIAIGSNVECKTRACSTLWVSRDGGASWHHAASRHWGPTQAVIAVDGRGHEVLYGASGRTMMRSDDFGESWAPTGGGGNPTVLPTYPQDGAILAASGGTRADYVLRHGASNDVTGSNNAEVDVQFRLSPDYPSGGGYSPVVLGAEDPVHEVPVVFRCSADFTCNQPVHLRVPTNEFNFSIAQIDLTLAGDYPRSGVVFANTSVGIQKSIDGGASFTPVTIVPTAGAAATFTPGFALAPGYREAGPVRTAYAAVLQYFDNQGRDARSLGGIYRTTDGGASWTPLASTGLFAKGAHSIAVAPDGRMFAGYDEGAGRMGLVCSTDATTWRPTCPPVGDHPVSAADEAALVSAAARQAPASSFPTLLVVTASVLAGICLAVGVWSARWTRRRSRRGVS